MATARKKPRLRPRRKPVQGRSRATVDAILEATARILVRRGWAGLTTNHVAERAGVSVGTLYEYFPSKESLVRQLVDWHLDHAEAVLGARTSELLADRRGLTAETLTRAMVGAMVELHADEPRLHRVLFEEVPHDATVRARVRALEDAAVATLAGVLRGVTRRDHAIAARLIVDLLETLTHRWVTSADELPIPAARLADELTTLIVAYLER